MSADKQVLMRNKEAELAAVVDRHDDLVRELFHMERFVTLITGFDPAVAKKDRSQVFLDYKAPRDLVSRFAVQDGGSTSRGSARTTRRALATVTNSLALAPPIPIARHVNAVASGSGSGGQASGSKRRREHVEEEDVEEDGRHRGNGKGRRKAPVKEEEEIQDEIEDVLADGSDADEQQTDMEATPRKRGRRPVLSPGPGEVLAYYIQENGKKSHRKVVVKLEDIGAKYVLAAGRSAPAQPVEDDAPRRRTTISAAATPPAPTASKRGPKRKEREPSEEVIEPIIIPPPAKKKRKATPPPYVAPDPFAGVVVPPPRFTHHEQVLTEQAKFDGSLDKYLSSYTMLEDKDADPKSLRDQINAAVRVKGRVYTLGLQGRLLPFFEQDSEAEQEEGESTAKPDTLGTGAFKPPVEPKRLPGHRDHLLAHVLQVRNAILQEHKNAIAVGRKNARSIQVYWEREKGKEEREQKEMEREMKASARALVKAIKARWKLAYKIVGARAQARAKAEQERLGQEHLSNILNRSLGMLAEGESIGSPAGSAVVDTPKEVATGAEDGVPDPEQAEGDEAGTDADMSDVAPDATERVSENGRGIEESSEEEEEPEVAEEREYGILVSATDLPTAETEPPTSVEAGPANKHDSADSASPEIGTADVTRDASSTDVEDEDQDFGSVENTSQKDHDMDVEMEAEEDIKEDDSEDEGLLADADVPIEELLRRYGYTADVADGLTSGVNSVDMPKEDQSTQHEDMDLEVGGDGPRRSGRSRRVRKIRDAYSPPLAPRDQVALDTPGLTADDDSDESESSEDDSSADMEVDQDEAGPDEIRVPFLLRATLRSYQKAGLDWLARAYRDGTNVILADDMGLGKTIQTIALLAHLACDLGEWGPHLIIVPTSVILNWEMEFKKFLPAFRVMTYYGSQKERKDKRKGWYLEGAFQVCITSYQIVLADQHIFKMRQWHYMILDEAHNIKNFRSQRWQTLLGFKSQRRLLLTGTPLQNNLMELWSLLYFLMPHGLSDQLTEAGGFANHREFIEWFSNPMDKAVETGDVMTDEIRATVSKLHLILRPYMLRRLKTEVEKELPSKFEHVLHCALSKRQRLLYDEFINRASTRESLQTGGYLGVANVLMKLRQVCNHPDLFEVRPIRTSFAMEHSVAYPYRGLVACLNGMLSRQDSNSATICGPGSLLRLEGTSVVAADASARLEASATLQERAELILKSTPDAPYDSRTIAGWKTFRASLSRRQESARWTRLAEVNKIRCSHWPVMGTDVARAVDIQGDLPRNRRQQMSIDYTLRAIRKEGNQARLLWNGGLQDEVRDIVNTFAIATPAAVTRDLPRHLLPDDILEKQPALREPAFDTLHRSTVKLQIAFPDSSLLQYDCGKLQLLASMLRRLKAEGHRVLIFTVMTRMLDILEIFLNHSGHRYFRLDGSTKVEDRLILTERFNTNPKVFAFIASTRSGGVGINLTGADTVIFYDNDFNPAMDKQAMDRAHRIGQTREVNVYRMVTAHTVEENMLRKANQKRLLDELVIQKGDFTTDFFAKTNLRDFLPEEIINVVPKPSVDDAGAMDDAAAVVADRDIELAFAQVEDEEDGVDARLAAQDNEADAADFGMNESAVASGKADREKGNKSGGDEERVSIVTEHRATSVMASDPFTPGNGSDVGGSERDEGSDEEGAGEEGEPGAVDEYMLRFAEWDY